jgi:hypothetical protein
MGTTDGATGQTAKVNGSARTQFKPGNPGPAKGLRRRGQGKGVAKTPRLLLDMRRVYNGTAGQDRTEGQRALRRLLEKQPDKFLARMMALEKALLAGRERAQAKGPRKQREPEPEPPGRDQGTERCMALLDEYLEALQAKETREEYERLRARFEVPDAAREAVPAEPAPAPDGGGDEA